jgi:hypothetical protein
MIGVLFSFVEKMMGGMCHENHSTAIAKMDESEQDAPNRQA